MREDIKINEYRTLIALYLRGDIKEKDLIECADLGKCCCCGHIDLNEYMHEYTADIDHNKYCDVCWEAR